VIWLGETSVSTLNVTRSVPTFCGLTSHFRIASLSNSLGIGMSRWTPP
jgi:hypothetical protein